MKTFYEIIYDFLQVFFPIDFIGHDLNQILAYVLTLYLLWLLVRPILKMIGGKK